MTRILFLSTALLFLLGAVSASGDVLPQRVSGTFSNLHGAPLSNPVKTDTTYVLGGPGTLTGKFQAADGQPAWHGWTSLDNTFSPDAFWSVTADAALVLAGSRSLWCGVEYPGPGPIPVPGYGYGNDWSQSIYYTYTVPNPAVQSSVVWAMKLQFDTEPGYDFVLLEYNRAGQWVTVASYDGDSADVATPPNTYIDVTQSFTVRSVDYAGPEDNQVQLRIRFLSDSGWSDEDGLWPTSRGACQVDDIAVTINGALVNSESFESGSMGAWVQILDPGVGNFAAIYSNLGDLDPCRTNWTPQVAFIDDGMVVPGTGGTVCITWCYGPSGYIVNNTGGLMGPESYIDNLIKSPPLAWPAGADAAYLVFEVYRHEELGSYNVWPGMFYQWHVRSTNTGNAADLETAAWRNRNQVEYGGPDYLRQLMVVSDLLATGRTHVQVSLRVIEYGWVWGWVGVDGTPAPYFDNVAFVAYATAGPSISANEIYLAQDNFPNNQQIDYTNLANNAVRFDMGRNVAPAAHLNNYPGDSIWFDVVAVRAGTQLVDRPTMHVKMKANPLFDGVRALPPGFTRSGNVITGQVLGDTTRNVVGTVVPDRFNFDLPDDDFFFPGDVIHYYIRAEDTGGGVSTLPGNLASYGNFDHNLSFSSSFIVRALPTMFSAVAGDQPKILFWNDFANRGGENEWMFALNNIGYREAVNFDLFYTNGPDAAVGNGLGGRATEFHLMGYDVLLYTSGNLSVSTLSNGDFAVDPSDDLGVVGAWLQEGKKAFMTGDDLIFSLNNAGAAGQSFVNQYFSVTFLQKSVLSLIHGQTTPVVRAVPGNGVIERVPQWIAYGGCLGINTFDAYTVINAQRLAEFTNPAGQTGVYPYAAASRYVNPQHGSDVIVMPYDFSYIVNAPGYTPPPGYAGIAARSVLLEDILASFGQNGGPISDVAPDAFLTVSNYPNPFNPSTTIKLNLPRAGEVGLKVFNVRGALVRTLVDGPLAAGAHDIVWDGKDAAGGQVASGVYFYETRFGDEVKVNKMALIK